MKVATFVRSALAAWCVFAVQAQAAEYIVYNPARLHTSTPLPVVVAATNTAHGFDRNASDSLRFDNTDIGPVDITTRRGAGTLMIASPPVGTTTLQLPIGEGATRWSTVTVQPEYPTAEYSGSLAPGIHTWDATTDRVITGDLVIPADAELTIEKGTLVRLYNHVNITVYGKLIINGSSVQPVAFLPETAGQPWGTLGFEQTEASISYCFFSGGGGDTTKPFGHSQSQPVLYAANSDITINNSFFVYNPGKALGSSRSHITINQVLISNCDTGGEFYSSVVSVDRSLIMDIPDGNGLVQDDDNDGFYFAGVMEDDNQAYSTLYKTTISLTEDDCIDHNGARIQVIDCLLERAYHEGVAASNGETAIITNTIVRKCDQGIEAGYGNPLVIVDHCVIINNEIGLRFGDYYDEPSAGYMRATNTVVHNNGDNILNFEPQLNASVPGALSVGYCLTNAAKFNDSVGCIKGSPLFDDDYLLTEESPGYRAGIDGTSMGLYKDGSASIVITELFAESAEGGAGDWLEIHNPFPLPRDIGFWSLEQGEEAFAFPLGTTIPAHGYIVVCRDSSAFRAHYSHAVQLLNGLPFQLGYSGTVTLKSLISSSSFALDSVTYTPASPWPARTANSSITLIDPFADNNEGANWYADPANGTPGYYQPRLTTDIPEHIATTVELSVAPQPFGNQSAISFELSRTAQIELLVYNAAGVRLRTLASELRAAGSHIIGFDATGLPAGALFIILKIDGTPAGFTGGIHIQND